MRITQARVRNYRSVLDSNEFTVEPGAATSGKDLGVVTIAQALPQSLVPAYAPAIIAPFGYPGLFISGAFFGLLGALTITRVKSVK